MATATSNKISNVRPLPKINSLKTPIKPVKEVEKKDEMEERGGLWSKESRNGNEYFTGDVTINGVKEQIVVFRNNFKTSERMPDWRIYKREPLDNGGQTRVARTTTEVVETTTDNDQSPQDTL